MDVFGFNPWWRTGRVPTSLVGRRRKIFSEVFSYLDLRQMQILYGPRRAGKTTLMFQVIDELLRKKTDPSRIFYYSFDEKREDIESLLRFYEQEILGDRLSDAGRVFLFLDEIQKLEGWPEKTKVIYDFHPKVKMFLSGSASIALAKESKESLAGRFFEFLVEPLDLEEYLEFTGTEIDRRREKVYELEIKRSLRHHALTGGFIEALALDDIQRKKYFRESLLERVIYRDIPEHFTVKSMDLPYLLMSVFCDRPGMLVDYRSLGNDLGHDQRTVAGYVSYLEYSLLAHKLYNFSPNRLTSEKKARKIYPSSTAFTAALSGVSEFAPLAEQYFAINLKARFFWRSPQKDEVDLVLTPDDRIIPVEIKMRETIKERDARPLFKFMARYGISSGLVISLDTEGRFDDGVRAVEVIPYWRYWTIKRRLGI